MQSDKRLSSLFRRGVEPAFDELVRRYREPLVAFAGGIAGRDRAEDVVQESLVKAHRSLARDDVEEPRAWLYRVVRNTALNEIRDGAKHDHAELTDRGAGGTGDHPSTEAERREELAMLIAALAELPEAQRTALVGRELGGFSHDELADRLGVSTGATKQLIFRARTGLRNALGALIPIPLIAWMASNAPGTFLASGGGAAAAGATGTAVGAGGTGATGAAGAGGGILAGLAGGGAAKVAVVAAVAGGTVAAGVAVEKKVSGPVPDQAAVVRTIEDGATTLKGAAAPGVVAGISFADGSRKAVERDRTQKAGADADPARAGIPKTTGEDTTLEPGTKPKGPDEGPAPGRGDSSAPGRVEIPGRGPGVGSPGNRPAGDSGSRPGGGRPGSPSGGPPSDGGGGRGPAGGSGGGSGGGKPSFTPPSSGGGGRGTAGGSGSGGGRPSSGPSVNSGGGKPSGGSGSSHGGGKPESQAWTPPVASAGPSQRPSAVGSRGGGRGPSAADRD